MVRIRERVQEIVDFAKTESPYRSANKGWVTDDVYLQWGPAADESSTDGRELAEVSIYWEPINQIALIIFAVVLIATIFVFSAVSLSHGKFRIFPTTFDFTPKQTIQEVKVLSTSEVDQPQIDASTSEDLIVESEVDATKPLTETSSVMSRPKTEAPKIDLTGPQAGKDRFGDNQRNVARKFKAKTAVDLFQAKSR